MSLMGFAFDRTDLRLPCFSFMPPIFPPPRSTDTGDQLVALLGYCSVTFCQPSSVGLEGSKVVSPPNPSRRS